MATKRITLILHHKGFLGRQEGVLQYIGGEFCVWEGLDIDTINKFTVETLCKEHYYRRFEKIYWLKPGRDLEVGLRELEKDAHVVNMCNAARKNAGEIEIFFIYPIEQTPPVCRPSCPPIESPLQTPVNSPIHMSDDSDDYESAEDSAYKPSPIVSEDDDMDDSVVKKKSGIKSKTTPVKRKIGAAGNDKGKRVAADASDEDEISIEEEIDVGSNVGNGEGDDISEDEVEEVDGGGNVGHREFYSQGMSSEPQVGPEVGPQPQETRTNVGVPKKPKKWTPPATDNPQTVQEEVNLSQGVPSSDPQDSQPRLQSAVSETNIAQANPAATQPTQANPAAAQATQANTTAQGTAQVQQTSLVTQPDSMNNSSTQQLPGQPSQGTINAASQGTLSRLMKFIPTPMGPSTKPK
ncbi:hypothetical protein SESBI_18816 [Sesbania bispinosa]|nr:hypothetical protein SESBI_18816 [Sesbania bispinosa]